MSKNKKKLEIFNIEYFTGLIAILIIFICLSACQKNPSSQKALESTELLCATTKSVFSQAEQDGARKALDAKGIPISNQSLMDAIESNDVTSVLDMIKLGANVEFIDQGSNHTPLTSALHGEKYDIVELLINNGASVNTKDGNRGVPFILAMRTADTDLAIKLIDKCADVNLYDGAGNAIAVAIEHQNVEMVQALIKLGADLNRDSGFGIVPLSAASALKSVEIVKLLVDHGANIKYVAKNGWTPLMIAIRENQYEIAEYLIENGANLNSTTNKGQSAVSFARDQGRQDVLDLLASNGIYN